MVFTTKVVHLLCEGFEGGCPPVDEADKIVIVTTVAYRDTSLNIGEMSRENDMLNSASDRVRLLLRELITSPQSSRLVRSACFHHTIFWSDRQPLALTARGEARRGVILTRGGGVPLLES
jgi:hypothetical protein